MSSTDFIFSRKVTVSDEILKSPPNNEKINPAAYRSIQKHIRAHSCSTSCPSGNQVDGSPLLVSTEAVAASWKMIRRAGVISDSKSNTEAVAASNS